MTDFATSIAIAGDIFKALQGFFFLVLPLILVGGLLYYKKKLTLFPVAALILERRDDNLIMKTDRIGRVRVDGIWKWKFRKTKETIPNPDYGWLVHGTYTPTNFFEKLANWFSQPSGFMYFYKYGSQQYKPIKVNLGDTDKSNKKNFKTVFRPILNEKGEKVYIKKIMQISPKKMVVPEFDVIDWDNMNFIVQEHAASDERRKKKDDFMKKVLIPMVTIAVAAIVLIIAMYFAVQLVQFGAGSVGSAAPVAQAEVGAGIPVIGGMMPS